MFTRYSLIGFLFCGLSLLGGCGDTLHSTWKSTRELYYTYVNAPAGIDYGDAGDLNTAQARLAGNMRPIDAELTRFERYMTNQDKPPNLERVRELFERFRWVNGVAALSPEGEVLAQDPPSGLKTLDFRSFAAISTANPRDPRGAVQLTPLGPEVLFGVPIFSSAELRGYYVAFFDIRLLADMAPDPGELIIMSPQGMLWPGGAGAGDTDLSRKNWRRITKSSVSGKTGGYYWICRYFGGVPLIFATPETAGSAQSRIDDAPAEPEEAPEQDQEPA